MKYFARRSTTIGGIILLVNTIFSTGVNAGGKCMQQVATGNGLGTLTCGAQDLDFLGVTGFHVYDAGATFNNATGIWEGACRGNDDYVKVSFTVDVTMKGDRYDVGMYVNTDGGSAKTSTNQCLVAEMTTGLFGSVTVAEIESAKDLCLDFKTSGGANTANTLEDYPFAPLLLKCADNFNQATGSAGSDGLLDFDIGIVWSQSNGGRFCNITSQSSLPTAETTSKCWHDTSTRVTLNIVVPPNPSPTSQPSESPSVSIVPTIKPSMTPSVSSEPSISTQPSSQPSDSPSLSSKPSSQPSMSPSVSSNPSSMPSESPSISTHPSSQPSDSPSKSSKPSSTPSQSPSISSKPSSQPSESPSISTHPSSQPSDSPSKSSKPSSTPSQSPSISSMPSDKPSSSPSTSSKPSSQPSAAPSVSSKPSNLPSESPSLSTKPSSHPTAAPSVSSQPSSTTESPSDSPSKSSQPSSSPSESPSISIHPTSVPSLSPSKSSHPSHSPSMSPSVSSEPSQVPSAVPSISTEPSTSSEWPSESPSISKKPSVNPTSSPSVSSAPTVSPSESPSAMPSNVPTDGYYYPDWENEEQICVNDGDDPEYMLEIQRLNYLYRSKEECCQNHFWWRITQCMQNEHPMYYSDGSKCDQKVFFEDWESNSPAKWSETKLFETLEECCIDAFWYDYSGCVGDSPKEMTFTFSIDISQLLEPSFCQDADIIANALGVAINKGLGTDSYADVTSIGCVTLSRNPESGNTECGGCLSGSSFIGDYDGTRPPPVDATGVITTVNVEVTTKSYSCKDSSCFEALYDDTVAKFSEFVTSETLTTEIDSWSHERIPPVKQLWNTTAVTNTLMYKDATNPFMVTADSKVGLEVVSGGSFNVNVDLSLITTVAELQALAAFFVEAIQSTLSNADTLPTGSTLELTTICGISLKDAQDPIQCSQTTTTVEYSNTMYLNYDADAVAVADLMNDVLQEPATLSTITSVVLADVAADSSVLSSDIKTALNSMTISSFSSAAVSITSLAQYYPDWIESKTCTNNGRQPPFIRENSIGYLFDSIDECCKTWFSYQPDCGQSTSSSSALKFYPDQSAGQCGQKALSNFTDGEITKYDSLFECCTRQFPNSLQACCEVDGLGGCNASGKAKYTADWQKLKCYTKDETYVQKWEGVWAHGTMSECCDASFPWNYDSCCENSGGC